MFTGIIQELGEVSDVKPCKEGKIFTIKAAEILKDKKVGDSISHNGACLTITEINGDSYKTTAIEETLKLTNLGQVQEGSILNLEGALKFGESLDGHIVQGHVDCSATVKDWQDLNLEISFPSDITKYLAYKGSITVNGVSLTISKLEDSYFTVSLIPHTIENTNLGKLKKNDKVNLEIDLIARYLESLLKQKN